MIIPSTYKKKDFMFHKPFYGFSRRWSHDRIEEVEVDKVKEEKS